MVGMLLALLLVVPSLAMSALLGHLDRPCAAVGRWWQRLPGRPQPPPYRPSIENIAADLRRLSAGLELAHRQDQPAKMARLTAASLAYDWVLLSAARTLQVPAPEAAPLDSVERLQTEAALAACGLDW